MNDTPYTTPDEDPFNIQPLQPRRRRSSLLNKWIQEQQNQPLESDATHEPQDQHCSVRVTPYLAYPDLTSDINTAPNEILTTDGYDLVEDDDIPQSLTSTLEVSLLVYFFLSFFFAVECNRINSSPQHPLLPALGAPQNSFTLRPRFEVLTSHLNPLLPQGRGHLMARHDLLLDYLYFRAAPDTVLTQPLGETPLINTTDHPVCLPLISRGETSSLPRSRDLEVHPDGDRVYWDTFLHQHCPSLQWHLPRQFTAHPGQVYLRATHTRVRQQRLLLTTTFP